MDSIGFILDRGYFSKENIQYMDKCRYNFVIMIKGMASFVSGIVDQVQGIISSWAEMFYRAPVPLMVEATFIPFRKDIISDGLVIPYNIIIGSGMKRKFKNVYMSAKKSGTIHQSL